MGLATVVRSTGQVVEAASRVGRASGQGYAGQDELVDRSPAKAAQKVRARRARRGADAAVQMEAKTMTNVSYPGTSMFKANMTLCMVTRHGMAWHDERRHRARGEAQAVPIYSLNRGRSTPINPARFPTGPAMPACALKLSRKLATRP